MAIKNKVITFLLLFTIYVQVFSFSKDSYVIETDDGKFFFLPSDEKRVNSNKENDKKYMQVPRCNGHNYGGRRCCTPENPCNEGEGDCDGPGDGGENDGHDGCKGDLVCGSNNCKQFGAHYHAKDDCCETPSSSSVNVWGISSGSLLNEWGTLTGRSNVRSKPPLGWSSWELWTECDIRCGRGKQSRNRFCSGRSCTHRQQSQERNCNTKSCLGTFDGWSSWELWTVCDIRCGVSKQSRHRFCSGRSCTHRQQSQERNCNTISCLGSFDGWNSWGPWTKCDSRCGEGKQSRHRYCSGRSCNYKQQSQERNCNTKSCLAFFDGWNSWEPWTECDSRCGEGKQSRHRYCSGRSCTHKQHTQERNCNTKSCLF